MTRPPEFRLPQSFLLGGEANRGRQRRHQRQRQLPLPLHQPLPLPLHQRLPLPPGLWIPLRPQRLGMSRCAAGEQRDQQQRQQRQRLAETARGGSAQRHTRAPQRESSAPPRPRSQLHHERHLHEQCPQRRDVRGPPLPTPQEGPMMEPRGGTATAATNGLPQPRLRQWPHAMAGRTRRRAVTAGRTAAGRHAPTQPRQQRPRRQRPRRKGSDADRRLRRHRRRRRQSHHRGHPVGALCGGPQAGHHTQGLAVQRTPRPPLHPSDKVPTPSTA